jgi:hypothetical protein
MATITFDTLKFVERLKAAGVPESQAKAEAEALVEAMGTMELATKSDLREMEARLTGELKLVKWMLAIVIAVNVLPILKVFF